MNDTRYFTRYHPARLVFFKSRCVRILYLPWPRRDFRLQTSDFGLRTSDFRLQTSDFRLQTSDFGLRTSDFGLRTSDFGLRTSDFRLRNSDFIMLYTSRYYMLPFHDLKSILKPVWLRASSSIKARNII